MTALLLRGTRSLVSLIVSLHVLLLRFTTVLADRKIATADKNVVKAQNGLEFARQAVSYARLSVREFKDQQIIATRQAGAIKAAAEAECKFLGRPL